MDRRVILQKTLEEILGSANVYFQPPETIQMKYPCIVYQLVAMDGRYADNCKYSLMERYRLTFISTNPTSSVPKKLLDLLYSSYETRFTRDGLNHTVLNVYF